MPWLKFHTKSICYKSAPNLKNNFILLMLKVSFNKPTVLYVIIKEVLILSSKCLLFIEPFISIH